MYAAETPPDPKASTAMPDIVGASGVAPPLIDKRIADQQKVKIGLTSLENALASCDGHAVQQATLQPN